MDYVLYYHEYGEPYENYQQMLVDENGKEIFSVWDLTDCPEDAIIGRDLFDADDYVLTLKRGMELAKQGYDDIVLVSEKE